jgi:hypothetical protein
MMEINRLVHNEEKPLTWFKAARGEEAMTLRKPIFIHKYDSSIQHFALLEDWEEAQIGGSIDIKKITASHLASNVCEYTRIYPGKIYSNMDKRKGLSVKELVTRVISTLWCSLIVFIFLQS